MGKGAGPPLDLAALVGAFAVVLAAGAGLEALRVAAAALFRQKLDALKIEVKVGLELDDIILDHAVPHVHVRKNAVRGLKTDHSERLLPLLGVSHDAAKQLAAMKGWGEGFQHRCCTA